MTNEKTIFNLYRKKTIELVESRFSKSLKETGIKISAKIHEFVKTDRFGPDLEAIKSFAITYRNFSLDKDPISIRNIAKIYDSLPENNLLRKEFTRIRTAMNDFLNSNTIIILNGKPLTRKNLIDVYLYGEIIHLNKHQEFEQWIKSTILREIIYNEIVCVLANLANFIVFIDTVNQDYLKTLEGIKS